VPFESVKNGRVIRRSVHVDGGVRGGMVVIKCLLYGFESDWKVAGAVANGVVVAGQCAVQNDVSVRNRRKV